MSNKLCDAFAKVRNDKKLNVGVVMLIRSRYIWSLEIIIVGDKTCYYINSICRGSISLSYYTWYIITLIWNT